MNYQQHQKNLRMKIQNNILKELAEKTVFQFKNEIQQDLWNHHITGQISDGMWENTPNTGWIFWCRMNTTIGNETKIFGDEKSGHVKYNFQLASLLQYTADDMIEIGMKYDPNYNKKKLRQDLEEIKQAMKAYGGK